MENIVRKGEIACKKQFLLFSQCFLPNMALIFYFKCTLKMSAICFNSDQFEILVMGLMKDKFFNLYYMISILRHHVVA